MAAKKDATPTPSARARPAASEARPLFTDGDGKAVEGQVAVLQVIDAYGPESGDLEGLPRRLELVGTFAAGGHTAAAAAAREAGVLPADAPAVTLSTRFVSAVPAPAAEVATS